MSHKQSKSAEKLEIEDNLLTSEIPDKIILYKRRFLNLFLFCLCTMMNACGWICFAPISSVLISVYGVSIFVINYLSQIYMIAYVPINFPSVATLDKLGLKYGVIIGIGLTTLGIWIRCLINESFAWVITGQTIMAAAQPFIYNAPAKLSANWFGEKERIFSTSIGSYANVLGVAGGCFVSSIFLDENSKDDIDNAKQNIFNMNLSVSIACSIIFLFVIFTFQDKPPTPPSTSYKQSEIEKHVSLKKDMIDLIKNRDYMMSAIANGLTFGVYFSFSTVTEQMISVYGFSTVQASYLGTSYLLAGLFGGVIFSIHLTYYKLFKLQTIFINCCALIAMGLVYTAMCMQNFPFLIAANILNGFFTLGLYTTAFELGVELTFPIGEATSGGFINFIANIIGFILVMGMTPILNNGEHYYVMICFIIFGIALILAIIFMALTQIKLRRQLYESIQSSIKSQIEVKTSVKQHENEEEEIQII